ncbi:MAG: GNAT family N-acetyltransferase [Alphaproteobacteria bacterium]|nr:GNAT family N-acetyltransferase [Alphaproteobacteria bacterium]
MTTIRRARASDAAAIGRVHVETWQGAYAGLLPDSLLVSMSDVRQSAWWSRALADPDHARGVFVAEDREAGIVGFGSCGPAREEGGALDLDDLDTAELRLGEVYTLYVDADFQNRGLGRALLAALFGQLTSDGFHAAMLWMVADNPSRFFYERLGGVVCGERTDRVGEAEVEEVAWLWRDLGAPLNRGRLAPE